MFDFLSGNPAVALLKEDHDRVKALFDQFEAAKSRPAKVKIVRAALTELKVHTAIEEEIFYPAVRKPVGKEIMNEADEEHHVAKLLIAELDAMDGSESHFDAKFHVLTENVRHHIKEEEGEMLPKAKGVKIDFEALAEKMKRRQDKLLADGVPPVGEEVMVRAARGKGDSPAQAAKRKAPKLPSSRSGVRDVHGGLVPSLRMPLKLATRWIEEPRSLSVREEGRSGTGCATTVSFQQA